MKLSLTEHGEDEIGLDGTEIVKDGDGDHEYRRRKVHRQTDVR